MSDATTTSIFIGNINGKIRKTPLKRLLYALCTPYGQILDIVVMRKPERLRGTAFVVFKEFSSIRQAVPSLNSSQFMGRQLRVEPALSKSRARRDFELHVLGVGVSDAQVRPAVSAPLVYNTMALENMQDMEIE
jgi:RNA recognition motif-containing protein